MGEVVRRMAADAPPMLADGSNPEGVMPSPPLDWKSKADLKDVVFYGSAASPPCSKIRTYLKYYGVPYTFKVGTSKPGSSYTKMPVLDVGSRQVNDSYIILENLIRCCTNDFNAEWEEKITFSLQLSVEDTLTDDEIVTWAFNPMYGFGLPGCLKCCLSGMIISTVRGNVKKASDPAVNPHTASKVKYVEPAVICKELLAAIPDGKTFHGGDEPNQVDISFYGTILPFYYNDVGKVNHACLVEYGLEKWINGMKAKMPVESFFPAAGIDTSKPIQ